MPKNDWIRAMVTNFRPTRPEDFATSEEWQAQYDDWHRKVSAELAAAEADFGAAIREYLWQRTRLFGRREYEEDLERIVEAVVEAALKEHGYRLSPSWTFESQGLFHTFVAQLKHYAEDAPDAS